MARQKKKRKKKGRILLNIVLILIILAAALFAGVNWYIYKNTGQTVWACAKDAKELVDKSTSDDFKLSSTSYIYSSDGTELAKLHENTDATYLKYADIPEDVVNAFVSVEDQTFWTNQGIDLKGILRVSLNYVVSKGSDAAGASTITQQLARAQFLTNEKTLTRKIKEIFIARELTKKYTKEQIMEFYCNTCCFANGIYGIEDAAQTYFNKSVDQLDVSQIAYLCAIPNRPEYYNPYLDSENAIPRRDKILTDMYNCGYITKDAMEAAKAEKIKIKKKSASKTFYNYEVTYAINCACRYMMEQDGFEFEYDFSSNSDYKEYQTLYDEAYQEAKHKLYTGGYSIQTTIDEKAQKKLQSILNKQLAFNKTKNSKTGIYQLQGAMTAVDNNTGKVIAIVGGRKQEAITSTYSLNRAYQSYRQPGSSFKPLVVYTPAMMGDYTATSRLKNINVTAAKKSTSSKISNMSGSSVPLWDAVRRSLNGCAYWLFNEISPDYGLGFALKMHFSEIVPSDYTLSAALGGLTHGVTTVEMANAYSTLENHGDYTQTDCIESITDSNGYEVYKSPESETVYDSDAADSMTNVMMGVIKSGTAKSMNWSSSSDTDAAGKTGTTNSSKDGWFCGYTPYYTIAVWVGYDTPKELSNLYGATYPASIWKESMLYLIKDQATAEFDITKKTYTSSTSSSSSGTSTTTDTKKTDTTTDNSTGTTDTTDSTDQSNTNNTDQDTTTDDSGSVDQIQGNDIDPSSGSTTDNNSSTGSGTGGSSTGNTGND